MRTTTISEKWQVCILKDVREKLGLKPHQKLLEITRDNEIVLKPLPSMLELKGSLKGLSGKKSTQEIVDELDEDWE